MGILAFGNVAGRSFHGDGIPRCKKGILHEEHYAHPGPHGISQHVDRNKVVPVEQFGFEKKWGNGKNYEWKNTEPGKNDREEGSGSDSHISNDKERNC